MTRRSAILLSAVSPLLARTAFAQDQKKRASPHETTSVDLGGKEISITYGRPYLKGRHVGDEVAPYGKVWRLGADEATKITLPSNTSIAGLQVPAGTYSLFAIPGREKWTVIINKVADQWGAFKYDESQDFGRFDLPVKQLPSPVEQFTITLKKDTSNAANSQSRLGQRISFDHSEGQLSLAWEGGLVIPCPSPSISCCLAYRTDSLGR